MRIKKEIPWIQKFRSFSKIMNNWCSKYEPTIIFPTFIIHVQIPFETWLGMLIRKITMIKDTTSNVDTRGGPSPRGSV